MKRMRYLAALWLLVLFPIIGLRTVHGGEKIRVTSETAEVKLGNKVITTVNQGAELDVVTRKGEWIGVKVTVDGATRSGWILQSDVETIAQMEKPPAPIMKFAADQGNGPQDIEIPDLVAVVKVKGINEITGKAQQMLMQINPMLGGFVSADALGQKVGNPGLKGIDRKQPMAFLILNPKKFLNPVVAVIPASNYAEIPKGQGEGVMQYAQTGAYALAGKDGEALKVVSEVLQGLQTLPAGTTKGEVQFQLSLARLMEIMKPEMERGIKELKNLIITAQQNVGQAGDTQVTAAVVEAELQWLLEIFEQTQEITLELAMSQDGLRIRSSLVALEASPMGQWLNSIPPATHQLASLLPPEDALFLMSLEIGQGGWWVDSISSLLRRMGAAANLPETETKEMENSVKIVLQGLLGTCAISVGADQDGISILSCNGCEGGADYRDAYRKVGKFWSEKSAQMGMGQVESQFQAAARVKDGVEIDLATTTIKLPEGQQDPQAQMSAQIMKVVYGGDSVLQETVSLEKIFVTSVGKNASKNMDWMIENVKKGGAAIPQDLATARTLFEEGGHLYGTVSLKKAISAGEQIAAQFNPALGPGGGGLEIPGPPVAFFGKAEDSRATFELYIPTKPIAVIQAYFMQKVMQMQGAGGAGGGGDGQPDAPGAF